MDAKEQERRRKLREKMTARWQDKRYREMMFRKQQDIGYRAYGSLLTPRRKI
jgi:hypothetical protein